MFCSSCGTENAAGARFCAKCGTALATTAPAPAAPEPITTVRTSSPAAVAAVSPTGKQPWLALVLSLVIVGVGQLYNNDWKKALAMFVGAILGIYLTAGIATFAIWIWSMVDAYRVASGSGKVW
jgi:TM2 domain-containing membrane protein YozV